MSKIEIYTMRDSLEVQALWAFCEWQDISCITRIATLVESLSEGRLIAKMCRGMPCPVICYFDGTTSAYTEFQGFAAFFHFLQSNGKLHC